MTLWLKRTGNLKLFDLSQQPLVKTIAWRGAAVAVVRDDLNHPMVSGNKLRKLAPNIEQAIQQNCQTLVTFGGAHSNHLLATAHAAKLAGLQSAGWVRGDELADHPADWSDTLKRCQKLGMSLHFVDRTAYREKHTAAQFQTHWSQYHKPYLLPEGGSNQLATEGVATLVHQLEQLGQRPSHLLCAVGTGATLAGLIRGVTECRWDCQVIGVCVLKGLHSVNKTIQNWLQDLPQQGKWTVKHEYHSGGYAKDTPDLIEFAQSFTASHDIPLDKIYTAKAFYALDQMLETMKLGPKPQPMIIHTGGLQGGQF